MTYLFWQGLGDGFALGVAFSAALLACAEFTGRRRSKARDKDYD